MATNSIRFVCTALLFSPELAGIAAARSDTGQNHELRTEPSDDPIVFQLRTGFLIVVDGKVGSLSGLKFILDTGTTHSVLDTKIADKLSLPRQNATVLNFDRQLKIGWSNVPELQIGSLRARNLRMMVAPLSESSELAGSIDGIIGLDILRLCRSVLINFDENRLTLRLSQTGDEAELHKTKAFVVHLNAQGRQLCLILDTGLRDMVLFEDRIRKNVPHLKLSNKTKGAREGWLEGASVLLQGIRMGSGESQAYAFVIPKAPQSLPADIDGFLGVRALNSSLVELDFEASALRLTGNETATLALNEQKMLGEAKGLNGPESLKPEKAF